MAAFAPSGFPEASLYRLSVPTAWPPALRAESEIPPGLRPRPPSRRGALGRQTTSYPGAQKAAWNRPRNQWRARLPGPSGSLSPRRTAHSFTRGRAEARIRPRIERQAGPTPPCTACRLRGGRGPPRSIFGHFLLIKKVATRGSGFCLTNSQTETLPMAQSKSIPAQRAEQKRKEARRSPSLSLSLGRESEARGRAATGVLLE